MDGGWSLIFGVDGIEYFLRIYIPPSPPFFFFTTIFPSNLLNPWNEHQKADAHCLASLTRSDYLYYYRHRSCSPSTPLRIFSEWWMVWFWSLWCWAFEMSGMGYGWVWGVRSQGDDIGRGDIWLKYGRTTGDRLRLQNWHQTSSAQCLKTTARSRCFIAVLRYASRTSSIYH
jgi:hypothetical protein